MAMGYGALGGLGEGLMNLGNMYSKASLQKKLEEERNATEQQREEQKEQRAADRLKNTVASSKTFQDADGVTWSQGVNAAGEPIGEKKLASPFEINEFNRNEEDRQFKRTQNQAALDKLLADTSLANKKLGDYDEDKSLDRSLMNARIDTERAQGDNYRASAARSDRTGLDGSMADSATKDQTYYARQLLQNNDSLVKSYTTGKDAKLSVDDAERIANNIVLMAAQQGKNNDWIQRAFRDALEARTKIKVQGQSSGSSGGLLGN